MSSERKTSPSPVTETQPTTSDAVAQPDTTKDGEADSSAAAESKEDGDAGEQKTEETGVEIGQDSAAGQASAKKNQKRKSSAGVPEHKTKKPSRKKSMTSSKLNLNLNATPGEHYWARLKGYPPWPAVICDEEMLPETLLATRPVTAMRPDKSYRVDYADDGKNVNDRTFPVMYLYTNEFSWIPNTDLTPLELEDVNESKSNGKTKSLAEAYTVAREGRDLAWYKNILFEHEQKLANDQALREEKKAKKDKKGTRKSKDIAEDGDDGASMEDAINDGATDGEGGKKAKPAKKRKKDLDSEGESTKPAKMPKTKLKVNLSKTPNGESASKGKSKTKATKTAPPKTPDAEASKPLTEEEKLSKKEKEVLYFRHKLQKGFLSRDQAPKEEEMQQMSDYFTSLEGYKDLEGNIVKRTKIHKVLKAIIRINHIPKDADLKFKQRSADLLDIWQKTITAEEEAQVDEGSMKDATTTNGVAKNEKSNDEKEVATEDAPTGTTNETTDGKDKNTKAKQTKRVSEAPIEDTVSADEAEDVADVSMADAKDDVEADITLETRAQDDAEDAAAAAPEIETSS